MQEKIKMYLEIENNIFDIKHQLLEYNQLLNSIKYIIGNNYNTNISYPPPRYARRREWALLTQHPGPCFCACLYPSPLLLPLPSSSGVWLEKS